MNFNASSVGLNIKLKQLNMGYSSTIEETISKYIEKNNLLNAEAGKVLVGISGGADSICLLIILRNLGYECEAVHCNFRLRGKESLRDETFVEDLCNKMGIKLHKRSFNTAQYASQNKISIEMAARELRYAYFKELIRETKAQGIAIGHHRDDNVETILLNLVRGSGIHGMCGIQPLNRKIIRPLLCVSRADILDYLERIEQDYVTDSSNNFKVFSRNRIRLDVMPLLNSINISASANIAAAIENINEAYKIYIKAIQEDIEKCYKEEDNKKIIDISKLLESASPRSVIHEILSPLGFTRPQEDDIIKVMTGESGKMFSAKSWRLLIDRGNIIIIPIQNNDNDIERKFRFASHEGSMTIDGCGIINYQIIDYDQLKINPDKRFAYLDVDKMHGPLTIRTVKQGDTFSPFGLKGKKLVSDFMTDLKLTRFEKEEQKVICDGDEIAWVVGKRSSEKFRVDETTKKVLVMELV